MEELISDLIELTRFEERPPEGEEERLDLGAVCRHATDRLPPTELDVSLGGANLMFVRGTESQLERAVFNVMVNAVRHARSAVELHIRSQGGRAQVVIDDDGSGVDPEDRERIFERFVRLDGSRGRHAGGSGIGLSLVRSITHRHGGSVHALDSPDLGGARFVFDLGAVCE